MNELVVIGLIIIILLLVYQYQYDNKQQEFFIGSDKCSRQKNKVLQKLYDKDLTNLFSSNLDKNDNILKLQDRPDVNKVYGEPCSFEIDKIISMLNINSNDVFYDLGSGNGNVCCQFLVTTPMKKAVGIELSNGRHDEAIRIKKEITTKYPELLRGKKLVYINKNFMDVDIGDATIIYTDDVLFEDKITWDIEKRAYECPGIKYFINMKQGYKPRYFSVFKRMSIMATWGLSRISIFTK